ncbi:MAG: hypothetical protein KKG47_13110 [Proteobacteria bacterium]|nr:hypothetical protein [Pseudomonadota bacterium]MBU1737558.1 hypothetical protein [Pseudomonadota bacterium]
MYTFINSLLKAEAYQHDTGDIKLVQTHISYVLLAGEYVYKIKKPVDFGFLDFSTLAKRKHYCTEEVVLNRRLCPDIYLEVVEIKELAGCYFMGGDKGVPVEYAVKMVRMPDERMMERVIGAGLFTAELVDALVETLIPFYQHAARGTEIDGFGSVDVVQANILENFTQSEPFVGCPSLSEEEYGKIRLYALDFLTRKNVFATRIREGWIRDCHGDLYSANICLADKIYIFDCIEFSRRLRCCDVASDIAFLAMDLDYHGLDELSERFVMKFAEKAADPGLWAVLNFYKCYRACVRGKIGLLTAHDPDVNEETRRGGLVQAARYFELAMSYAETP